MSQLLRIVCLCFLVSLLCSSASEGATKLIDWNFNTATFIDGNGGDTGANASGRAMYLFPPAGITTNSPSPGSGGKSALATLDSESNPSRTQPVLGKAGNWGLREFYASLYMYIHPNIADSEIESIKLFEVSDSSNAIDSQTQNWFILQLYPGAFNLYSSGPASGTWFGNWSGFLPGAWHKYSVYVKYNTPGQSNGIVKVWVDDVLKGQITNVTFWNANIVVNTFSTVYHFKTFGSQIGTLQGNVQLDDIQLWDGLPGNPPPAAPQNLKVQ